MPYLYKTAREYVNAVCSQIRWKKARDGIREELEGHISDQRAAYIGVGMSEVEATEKAVEQMGDPVEVGAQLDRLHRPKPQPMMLLLVFAIVLSGLVFKILVPEFSTGEHFMIKQVVSLLLGTASMFAVYFFDYSMICKYPKRLFWAVIAIICGSALLVKMHLASTSVFASFSLMLPVAFTGVIFSTRSKGYFGIFICLAALSVQTFLCFIMPSVTCGAMVFLCGMLLTGLAISKNHFHTNKLFSFLMLGAFLVITAFIVFHIILNGRMPMRLNYAFSPQDYSTGGGWMSMTIRETLANASFAGKGEVPDAFAALVAHQPLNIPSDWMLFYLIHRYGWVSFILIAALFGLFFGKAARACARLKSVAGIYVCTAVLLVLAFQFVLYCTANLGFNLLSPLSLPLFSGGSATAVNLGLVGLMLSAFRNDCSDKSSVCTRERESRFCLKDGKLIINLNL